jgi:hypothetical protein
MDYPSLFLNLYFCRNLYYENKYLFTHAGITKHWADTYKIRIENIVEQLNQFYKDNPTAFIDCGFYRGGFDEAGSPLWADVCEHADMEPWLDKEEGYVQIFGHSQLRHDHLVLKDGAFICLDCRKVFVLENNEISVWN